LQLVDEYKPAALAIESQFYGKQCAVHAETWQGTGSRNLCSPLPVSTGFEYAPRKIKQSITGLWKCLKRADCIISAKTFLNSIPCRKSLMQLTALLLPLSLLSTGKDPVLPVNTKDGMIL